MFVFIATFIDPAVGSCIFLLLTVELLILNKKSTHSTYQASQSYQADYKMTSRVSLGGEMIRKRYQNELKLRRFALRLCYLIDTDIYKMPWYTCFKCYKVVADGFSEKIDEN
ncbi:hypothetical protein AVEN_136091-1 [Araneus ventricosus]|uniref:Uncharacterized protein n=2 Tax=Araneus ventricosus TaxID=182803 RepID=A0A4Y2N823_ARAVE|nr:hypothetical protein AVEN_136091-1 [Araneus ventricosus]